MAKNLVMKNFVFLLLKTKGYYNRVFTDFDSKSGLEFLILDCNTWIILKIIKDIGLMTPRRFNIYIKPLSWNTQHKNKLELNAEIIARTKDIQDVWNFHLFVFMTKSTFK